MEILLYIEGMGLHNSQVYTGFGLLEEAGLVRLKFCKGQHYRPLRGIIVADFFDKKVVYDMGDNPETVMQEYYPAADVYFKRMAHPDVMKAYPKIMPLGFNYGVYHTNDHFLKRAIITGDKTFIAKAIVQRNRKMVSLIGIKPFAASSTLQQMSGLPNPLLPPKILFAARLWNAQTGDAKKDAERQSINAQRIAIIKRLRLTFGSRYVGGIEESPLARQQCPELILPKNLFTQKGSYLKHLESCTIGIATPGLEASIGYKFAEYIAFSKAIVSTPVNSLVPGNFSEGSNYLSYVSVEECLEQVGVLMEDKTARESMMENNFLYYQQYLRPDKLVWNSILQVLDK